MYFQECDPLGFFEALLGPLRTPILVTFFQFYRTLRCEQEGGSGAKIESSEAKILGQDQCIGTTLAKIFLFWGGKKVVFVIVLLGELSHSKSIG